jgi:hypothetical protein
LAAIRNGVAILEAVGDDRELSARTTSMIERQLAQLIRLIDDLLAFRAAWR